MLCRLRAAREKGPEGYIISPSLRRNQSAVPGIAAGHPDDPVRPEEPPRLGIGHVLFADMHPVAVQLSRQIRPVVHDEGDAALLRDRLQDVGGAPDLLVFDILQPELQAGDIAAGERLVELLGETVGIERGRRDQVETRRRPRVVTGANDQSFP